MQKNANQKINKEKTKVKDYAKRLQEWGLDTNYNRGLLLGAKANSNGWSGCVYYVTRNKKNAQSSTSSASLK